MPTARTPFGERRPLPDEWLEMEVVGRVSAGYATSLRA